MTNRTALVTGAGIGGLAVAAALLQTGRSPVLVDDAPLLAPLDGAVALDTTTLAALDVLGVGDLVRSRSRIAPDPRSSGFALHVARADLQTALFEQLGCDRIRFGREVCCARQDDRLVRLRLIGGDELAAPLLVDAAGPGSPVRASIARLTKARRLDAGRRAFGRIALVGGELDAIGDAVALAAALAADPVLEDALEAYARSAAPAASAPRPGRLRFALAPRPRAAAVLPA